MTQTKSLLLRYSIALSCIIGTHIAVSYGTIDTTEVTVKETGSRMAVKGESFFNLTTPLVHTTDGRTFQDSWSMSQNKWKHNKFIKNMKPGEKYKIKSNGLNFLWYHKNILSAEKLK